MNFIESLSYFKNKSELQHNVYSIKGAEDSPLFLSSLVRGIASLHGESIQIIDCQEQAIKDVIATLEVSFLGTSAWYWLKNVSSLSASQSKQLREYLASYAGGHCVWLSDDLKFSNSAVVCDINLTDSLLPEEFGELFQFLFNSPADPVFIKNVYGKVKNLSFDRAILLMHYHGVLSKKRDDFFAKWLDRLVPPSTSFFTLSQSFFAKDIQTFLPLAQALNSVYPEEFWVSYWSEQLWQATMFVSAMRQHGNVAVARKGVNRLPFSFMQRDWRSYSLIELAQAHAFLYQHDYNLKHGAKSISLEFFCLQFMHNVFKS